MHYIVTTTKSVADAARDLEAAVQKHRFGVLHVYDLTDTLAKKGHTLGAQCRVFDVCNPQHAARVLAGDMNVSMALPCRISVFEDRGATKIGTLLPTEILRGLSPDPELTTVATTVEAALKAIIDDTAATSSGPRHVLQQRRAALAREIEAGVAKRAGDRDGNVPDSAELAAADVALDVGLAEVDRDVAELEATDAALERLDRGTYGSCVDCGAAVDPARLAANPSVARCKPCQQRREHSAKRAPRL